jgi:hypothetical protein
MRFIGVLGRESEGSGPWAESQDLTVLFGSYNFVGCLTRVLTDTSTCNRSPHVPVETQHPRSNIKKTYLIISPEKESCKILALDLHWT